MKPWDAIICDTCKPYRLQVRRLYDCLCACEGVIWRNGDLGPTFGCPEVSRNHCNFSLPSFFSCMARRNSCQAAPQGPSSRAVISQQSVGADSVSDITSCPSHHPSDRGCILVRPEMLSHSHDATALARVSEENSGCVPSPQLLVLPRV